jgi:hypothetical protein
MGAIAINPESNRAEIDRDNCVECYQCYRGMSQEHLNPTLVRSLRTILGWMRLRFEPEPDVCPTASFEPEDLAWPRVVRRAFSDVTSTHESTGVHGRGTEEVKTNDVTHRVQEGEAGFVVEFGRPGVGARFRDIGMMTTALANAGAEFEENNPVTHLMTDPSRGTLRSDILDEKVLSAIVEIKTPLSQVEKILDVIETVGPRLETVVSLGIGAVCGPNGSNPLPALLSRRGFPVIRGKTNLGLGRATNADQVVSVLSAAK